MRPHPPQIFHLKCSCFHDALLVLIVSKYEYKNQKNLGFKRFLKILPQALLYIIFKHTL